ncbi:MAG: FlgD immunoglobulin-like domain containing protein [Candidatus Cloacimonetes bacterium]|nr:FlgD immunoglobulin-like domain containing protein [Candidatus Cloacimonadota bacterium]
MRNLMVIFILLLLSVGMLEAQASFGTVLVGISSNNTNPQLASAGDVITVTYQFTPTGFDEELGVVVGSSTEIGIKYLTIKWYEHPDGTGETRSSDTGCDNILEGSQNIENNVVNTKTLTFTLPSFPSLPYVMTSFRIETTLTARNPDTKVLVYSQPTISTGVGSTSFAFLSKGVRLAAPNLNNVGSLQPTTSSITAKWRAVSNANAYELDVSESQNFEDFLAGYNSLALGNVTSCVVNNLAADNTYYYRVRACGGVGSPYTTSLNSNNKAISTIEALPGIGSTYIRDSNPARINVGNYFTELHGIVSPNVIIDPAAFIPSSNDRVDVAMDYGYIITEGDTLYSGLQYNLSFNNATIGNATFTLSYLGLDYHPEEVAYYVGDLLFLASPVIIDTDNQTITFSVGGMGKETKANFGLKVVINEQDMHLPVTLTSFTSTIVARKNVKIVWVSQSETNHLGYNLLRADEKILSLAFPVNPEIICEGIDISTQVTYSYIDKETSFNSTYYYWLESISQDGTSEFFGPLTVRIGDENDNPEIPEVKPPSQLFAAFPNPFNPNTNIRYRLREPGTVKIEIYNSRGQLIRSFSSNHAAEGFYQVSWDGRDHNGNLVASGVYMYTMRTSNYTSSKKMILAK